MSLFCDEFTIFKFSVHIFFHAHISQITLTLGGVFGRQNNEYTHTVAKKSHENLAHKIPLISSNYLFGFW